MKRYCPGCGRELTNHGNSPRCRKCYITPEYREKLKRITTGRHLSKETRQKLSGALRGLKRTPEQRSRISKSHMGIGHKHTLLDRLKMSIAQRGELGNGWKGGVYRINQGIRRAIQCTFEYRQWRSDIFHRDNFTCQKCGDFSSGNLRAHHLKTFQDIINLHGITTVEQARNCEELWDINNGVTLCVKCHKKAHNRRIE
jgi:hypothetical protein